MWRTQKLFRQNIELNNTAFVELSEAEQSAIVGGKKGSFDITGDPSQWEAISRKVNEYEGQH